MKAKPKSFALAKFQQAGQLAIAKNKAAKVAFLSPFPVVWGGGGRGASVSSMKVKFCHVSISDRVLSKVNLKEPKVDEGWKLPVGLFVCRNVSARLKQRKTRALMLFSYLLSSCSWRGSPSWLIRSGVFDCPPRLSQNLTDWRELFFFQPGVWTCLTYFFICLYMWYLCIWSLTYWHT